MTYALGTATGKIELEYDGTGVEKAKDDVEGLQKKSGDAEAGLNKLGNVAGVAGAAIAGGLAVGVNAAANFEKGLSAIEAVSGATAAEMDKVREKALQLGKETAFSAGESAAAMEELIKAGLSVEDTLNGAADATVALAAAGEVELKEAATIASNAMNQFGLAAKDMPNVADKIAGAANASAIDVKDFGYSISQAGAVANLAGVSFDDTAAAIALMGNAGIKGSDAGTSLKSMLMRLQPTTQKAYNQMEQLGLITVDTNAAMKALAENGIKNIKPEQAEGALKKLAAELAGAEVGSAKAEKKFIELGLQSGALRNEFYKTNGETKSMAKIAGELSGAMEGLNKRQQQAALTTLFGADAIRGAAILAKEGEKGFNDMGKAMGKVTAAEVAATRMDNLKGSIEEMMGSLETLGIALGTILLPPLRKVVDAVTGLLNWFLNLDKGTQTVIVGILAAVAALLLIFAAVVKTVLFISSLSAALTALKGTMIATWAAALGPIALIIAAIAAVIAIFVLLYKKNETFRKGVQVIWAAIKAAVVAVIEWFKTLPEFFSNLWDDIKAGLAATRDFFKGIWDAIVGAVTAAWTWISNIVTAGINFVKGIINTVMGVIVGIWKAWWGLFGPLLKAIWGLITAIVKLGWTIIKGLFILYLRLLKKIFSTVWNAIVKVVKVVWKTITGLIKQGLNTAKAIIMAVWNFIKRQAQIIWGAITAVLKKVWEIIGPFVKQRIENIKNNITRVWNAIKDVTSRVWNALKDVVGDAIDKVVDLAAGIKDRVLGFFKNAGTWLYDKGKEIIQGLLDGITGMIGKVTDKIESVTGTIGKFLPGSPVKEGPLKVLNRGYAGKQIVQMLVDGLEANLRPVAAASDTIGHEVYRGIDSYGPKPVVAGGGTTKTVNNNITVQNPRPERAGQSVSKVIRTRVEEEGWNR